MSKILKIKPQSDRVSTVPNVNLFPANGSKGSPEIYVMGHRNPFSISVDHKTGYLYWGEVGPDAGLDSLNRGSKGYDEFNQARKASNLAWPFLIGNNKPYRLYDFNTGVSEPGFDPLLPTNESVNIRGYKLLPAAQPSFIWYPTAIPANLQKSLAMVEQQWPGRFSISTISKTFLLLSLPISTESYLFTTGCKLDVDSDYGRSEME